MARAIWKYPLDVADRLEVPMPEGAQVLCVREQYGNPMLWALVNPSAQRETRCFITVGTGHPMPEGDFAYVGSYLLVNGDFVGHVFEEKS